MDETGNNVTITGKGGFTLGKARALAKLLPEILNLNEKTTPVTLEIFNQYETFRGGLYKIGVMLKCEPSANGGYALIDVSEMVREPTGGESFLTKYAFSVNK